MFNINKIFKNEIKLTLIFFFKIVTEINHFCLFNWFYNCDVIQFSSVAQSEPTLHPMNR